MTLIVNAIVVAAPDKTLGAEDFQLCLIGSKTRFKFKDSGALKAFLAERAMDFAHAQKKFEDVQYEAMFAPVAAIQLVDHHNKSELHTDIQVTTEFGPVMIQAFLSLKRHALISFSSNFTTPRDAKQANSIVRDTDVLLKCFKLRVERLADSIKARGYVFQLDPQADNKFDLFGEMNIISDSLPVSQVPAKGLQVHLFPDQGKAVRRIPNHEQYAAMVTFLLWYYRSDENSGITQKVNQVERTERKLGSGNKQYQQLVGSLDGKVKEVKERAQKLADAGIDFGKGCATTDKLAPSLHGPSGSGCKLLYELLARHGMIPSLPPSSREASGKPLGGTGEFKARIVDTTNTVVFKTHKIEVQSKLAHMPWDIIAWLLEGQLVIDISSGQPTVRLMLESWQIDKSKYASVGTDDPPTALRKKAHTTTRKDLADKMIDSYTQPSKDLHEKVNRFCELYRAALGSGIPQLQALKL